MSVKTITAQVAWHVERSERRRSVCQKCNPRHASVATVGLGQEAGECPGGCLRERAKLTQTLELSTEAFTSWRARDHAVDLCNRTSSPRPFHLRSNFPGEYCNRQRIRPPKTIPMCESRHLGTRPRKWQHTARTPDLKPTIKGSN
jgi:hypothetical protein